MSWIRRKRKTRSRRRPRPIADAKAIRRFGRGSVLPRGWVQVRKRGENRGKKMHRLIYRAFVGSLPRGYDVDHKNGKRHDNRKRNLRRVKHSRHPLVTFKGKSR